MNLYRKLRILLFPALVGSALLLPACGDGHAASDDQKKHDAAVHAMHGGVSGGSEAVQEYGAIMDRMHEPMMASMVEPDPDVSFVKGMIPHHQGGVEMAEWVIKYGRNPEIRQLAVAIVAAQTKEIEQMHAWLAKHDGHKH